MAQYTEQDIERDAEDKPQDKEFMATLAKGLALLGAFDKQRPAMTLSEAAKVTGFSRATARRILRTLAELGYVAQNGRAFSLSSGILRLGFAYLATQNWIEQDSPLMRQLSEEFHESCSAAILEGTEIVYVARYPARRIMSVTLAVGTRLPAFHTSLGRVQLGFLDDGELWCRLRTGARGPRARIFHRRRGTGARPALDCGADRRSRGRSDRRAQYQHALHPHDAQRDA